MSEWRAPFSRGLIVERPKRNHYVAKWYLKGFATSANEERIRVYDRRRGECFITNTINAAVETDFNLLEGGLPPNALEHFFAKVEAQAKLISSRLVGELSLTNAEREQFAFFLALALTRVPYFRRSAENMQKLIEELATDPATFELAVGNRISNLPLSIEELRQYQLSEAYGAHRRQNTKLLTVPQAWWCAPIIVRMSWTVLRAPQSEAFVTSDNPFIYLDSSAALGHYHDKKAGVGLLQPGVKAYFPLDKNTSLQLAWDAWTIKYEQANQQRVQAINKEIIGAATRFVYASAHSAELQDILENPAN